MPTVRKRRYKIFYFMNHCFLLESQIFLVKIVDRPCTVVVTSVAQIFTIKWIKSLLFGRKVSRKPSARSGERRISIIASNCFIIPTGANNRRCLSVCRLVASLYKQLILFIPLVFLALFWNWIAEGHSPASYSKICEKNDINNILVLF